MTETAVAEKTERLEREGRLRFELQEWMARLDGRPRVLTSHEVRSAIQSLLDATEPSR